MQLTQLEVCEFARIRTNDRTNFPKWCHAGLSQSKNHHGKRELELEPGIRGEHVKVSFVGNFIMNNLYGHTTVRAHRKIRFVMYNLNDDMSEKPRAINT